MADYSIQGVGTSQSGQVQHGHHGHGGRKLGQKIHDYMDAHPGATPAEAKAAIEAAQAQGTQPKPQPPQLSTTPPAGSLFSSN